MVVKHFVTGGAGFIGSNFVRHILANSDDEVTVFDALTYAGNLQTLHDVEEDRRYRFVKGDICDREAVAEAMAGHDTVVHFAAESHVDRSIVSPDEFVRTNCNGTNVVCDVARRLEVQRMLRARVDRRGVRLGGGGLVHRGGAAATGGALQRPKAGSDLIADATSRETYGLRGRSRSSNNFGPYQYPEKVIPLFVTNLLDGRKVPLYGDG